jgi:hypothetical protein
MLVSLGDRILARARRAGVAPRGSILRIRSRVRTSSIGPCSGPSADTCAGVAQ